MGYATGRCYNYNLGTARVEKGNWPHLFHVTRVNFESVTLSGTVGGTLRPSSAIGIELLPLTKAILSYMD